MMRRTQRTTRPASRTRAAGRVLFSFACVCAAGLPAAAGAQPYGPAGPSARALAPVDLTGYWVSIVHEDWAWRMRTPPAGDYASVPLNAAGRRVADTWTPAQDGSCLAFGAAALLRMPARLHVTWADDETLVIETDNGLQTRRLHFGVIEAPGGPRTLQGFSRAAWQIADVIRSSGANAGQYTEALGERRWASLEVVTTNLRAAWLRPNGVPYSESARVTEYFDRFADGAEEWLTVTTIVDDPTYLTEPFVISSNFRREVDGSEWDPEPCRAAER